MLTLLAMSIYPAKSMMTAIFYWKRYVIFTEGGSDMSGIIFGVIAFGIFFACTAVGIWVGLTSEDSKYKNKK